MIRPYSPAHLQAVRRRVEQRLQQAQQLRAAHVHRHDRRVGRAHVPKRRRG
jgi:hypothetical protein